MLGMTLRMLPPSYGRVRPWISVSSRWTSGKQEEQPYKGTVEREVEMTETVSSCFSIHPKDTGRGYSVSIFV
jgi:hypothetical protein